jgi:osmotically-inducible protein OsmY
MTKTKDIRELVENELTFDPLIDPVDISVMNIKGEVALRGTVTSYPQCLEAGHAARRVYGVRKVHNHITVDLPRGDLRDDAELTAAADLALNTHITVPAGVSATAKDGDVMLQGIVEFAAQRTAAADAIAGLTGVRRIKNKIAVVSAADGVDVAVRVQDALDRYSLVSDDSDVLVKAEDHTVSLFGHVRTWVEHDAVLDAAWRASGVWDVRDDLIITG